MHTPVKTFPVVSYATAALCSTYLDRFRTVAEALDFETLVLSADRAYLPACARVVIDHKQTSGEYWGFLIEQHEIYQLADGMPAKDAN